MRSGVRSRQSAMWTAAVLGVEDVRAAVAAGLARADVDDRHAEERALADADAGVADQRAAAVEQPQEIGRLHVLEEVNVGRPLELAEGADAGGGAVGAGVDVRPEPQARNARIADGAQRLGHVRARLRVLGGHRVLHDHQVAVRQRHRRADAAVLLERIEPHGGIVEHVAREIDRRTAGDVHRRGVFAHPDDAFRRARGRDQVHVGELRHGMAHLLVDRSGDLAALHVRERDVHVGSGDRGGQRLVAVGDGNHDVGAQVVQHRGQLQDAEAGGLGHRRGILALEHDEDLGVDAEAVALHVADGAAVAIEQRRRGDDELQLQRGMRLDRGERGFDPAVAGPGGDDDANLTHGSWMA
jgi:hypothetical protein